MVDNPYAEPFGPFTGRRRELETLERELLRGRGALAAIMAGRGMGKTRLARKLCERLDAEQGCQTHYWPRTPGNPEEFLLKLGRDVEHEFSGTLFVDEVIEAITARAAFRTILVLDEVDDLIQDTRGRAMLDNLRIAWEQLAGQLGVVILGGSMLYELLESKVSPFLRNAEFLCLQGLSLEEVGQLVRQPLGLDVPDDQIELLWLETAGHPALLTDIMKTAVDRGVDLDRGIPLVIEHDLVRALEDRYFPIWWKNLQPRGQSLYRTLVEYGKPVPRVHAARSIGGSIGQWSRVLETTGVLHHDQEDLLPRGELFARWARREHFADDRSIEASLPSYLDDPALSLDDFERELLDAIARWSRGIVEYAGLGLLLKESSTARGNARFLPEAHFQLSLLLALQQRGWRVEAEGWSIKGRSDLKVEQPMSRGERACVELKIWGRAKHLDAAEQVAGYALPSDTHAHVVMLDRNQRSLLDTYRREVIEAKGLSIVGRSDRRSGLGPHVTTLHPQAGSTPLRIHHFLVQFPGD